MKPITDKEYSNPETDWDRIKSNLTEHRDFLDTFDHLISEDLMLTNLKIINQMVKLFDIHTELTIDYETDLRSTERLVDICCAHGADKYLAGIGKPVDKLTNEGLLFTVIQCGLSVTAMLALARISNRLQHNSPLSISNKLC